ncbi:phage conserved hypothetical protein BR0599 [Monaibacterium marinum]|uniref:Bacteriophage phiJL001 Gp84 C-terminal domain-containing protein n=1 Tax=Pontivivens marinum TaxID=1690039 RepID=A0A2C9CTB8_9RHOB|nr:DUF2163 domain-containing protein [Monaibacterium marinum]SOH94502.1 phage conserved hypothetical protein BR0599 [Monaibacterium marinum]
MRDIPTEMQARLDSGATTLCRCWLVTRADGEQLGFTDHDRSLVVDGVRYAAESGLSAGALDLATGMSADNGEVLGALSADAIREVDIAAGLYDGAEVKQWLVDWQRTDLKLAVFTGRIGEIRRGQGAFEAELRSLVDDLNRPVGRALGRDCDATLGDARCGVDLTNSDFRAEGTVTAIQGDGTLVVNGLAAYASGWFAGGVIAWTGGGNAGTRSALRHDTSRSGMRLLGLRTGAAFEVAIGDTFDVISGCDRRAETCRAKFSNFMNFRGFPHIPGEDWLTSYPNQGEVHDGGSLRES